MNRDELKQWCDNRGSFLPLSHLTSCYLRKPLVMGVLNITPDSFSDGGRFLDVEAAFDHAQVMIEQGADIIDIGGESSRPGALPVDTAVEMARIVPVIRRIRSQLDICISIDTSKADVMLAAVDAGASMINDIYALKRERALEVAGSLGVPVCLMHMRGIPENMQQNPHYLIHVVEEINAFFRERVLACEQAGILREQLILDPGFGFGKSVQHNLVLLQQLKSFQCHNLPVLLGVSRKSTLGRVLHNEVHERMSGGLAVAVFAALNGVTIIRTHDVGETNQTLQMLEAIVSAC